MVVLSLERLCMALLALRVAVAELLAKRAHQCAAVVKSVPTSTHEPQGKQKTAVRAEYE